MKDTVHHGSLKGTSPVQNDSIMRDMWRVIKWEQDLSTGEYQGGPLYLYGDGYYSHLSYTWACAIIPWGT